MNMPDPLPEPEPTEHPLNLDEEGEQADPDRDLAVPVGEAAVLQQPAEINETPAVPSDRGTLHLPGFTGVDFTFRLPRRVGGEVHLNAGSNSPGHGREITYAALAVIVMLFVVIFVPNYTVFALVGFFALVVILVLTRRGGTND